MSHNSIGYPFTLGSLLRVSAAYLAFSIAAAAIACSAPAPTGVCTANIVFGISIKVQSATTGAAITDSALVQVTDGAYAETYRYLGALSQPFSGTIYAAAERTGTYGISIRKNGFAPYDTSGVRVTRNACHVEPVIVVARLQPTPTG